MSGDFRWSVVDGVVRLQDESGNESVCGDRTPTPQEDATHRQEIERALSDTEEDKEAYERLQYEDPDFETIREKMRELAAYADPEDAKKSIRPTGLSWRSILRHETFW
jgi:hypothetical protein